MTAPEALAAVLRRRILDGELAAGTPLREQHLAAEHDLARHTVRAALRALATEGLVRVEANRGARVAALDGADVRALGELRIALEVEGARLALARHGGRLPAAVHAACADLARACAAAAGFGAVAEAHDALHHAIVAASQSARIVAAHRALSGELRLFLVQLRPAWDVRGLADEHAALVAAIERDGPDALRPHVEASTRALLASFATPAARA
ncbi:MAG TPA: GntR family transcriptional regulator [Solirubrobacteraceae bacterium]|nr:GntR family transcriptional regulator [Solirubrobacteraceae bacterium]